MNPARSPSQSPSGHLCESQSPSPTDSSISTTNISTVRLHDVPIVSLHIDGKERLCLAQISNTLLKDYSYNEIHNRRVALGITCVQCTPVQLEVLRRAGAMPISSRRCGMITKREAERLVKSFLDDVTPPKLPDNFSFEVYHRCGWGCRGSFLPSRYNSSRAKCIRCAFCQSYFSPNKFIFHCHKLDDGREYRHPDAANFNAWRRHLYLCEEAPSEELIHSWEDVKAMFNGGNRKRILSTSARPTSSSQSSNIDRSPVSIDGKCNGPIECPPLAPPKRSRWAEAPICLSETAAAPMGTMLPLPGPGGLSSDLLTCGSLPGDAWPASTTANLPPGPPPPPPPPGCPVTPWQLFWSKHVQFLAAAAGHPAAGMLALQGGLGRMLGTPRADMEPQPQPPSPLKFSPNSSLPPMAPGESAMTSASLAAAASKDQFQFQFQHHQQQQMALMEMKKDYSIDAIMRRAAFAERR